MARINKYELDANVTANDKLIGTDGDSGLETKNFSIDGIADYVIDKLIEPDATDFHIPVFNQGGVRITDSIISQDSSVSNGTAGTTITITGNLSVTESASIGVDLTVEGVSYLQGHVYANGNVDLGDTSSDIIKQHGTLELLGPVKDSTGTIGNNEQVLVSNAQGKLAWENYQGSGLEYQAAWNADTDVPDLTAIALDDSNTGKYWVVSTAGTTDLGGITDWSPGDWAIVSQDNENNVFWNKIGNSSVDGTGIANKLAVWTSEKTLGAGPITINGNDALFAEDILLEEDQEISFDVSGRVIGGDELTLGAGNNNSKITLDGSDSTMRFITGNSTAISINDSQNVGIGTTTPGEKLHIRANEPSIRLQDITSNHNHYLTGNDGELRIQTSGYITMRHGNSPSTTFSANGDVGIGTTNPSTKLHIRANEPSIRLQDASSTDNHYLIGNNGEFKVQTSGYMTIRPGNSVSATFLANGNVGIGTALPAEKLDVKGNIQLSGNVINASNTAYYLDLNGTSRLNHGDFISTLKFGSFTSGVKGTLFEGYSTHSVVRTDSARLDFHMGKTATGVGTMMSLTDTGNVGIGTTSPSQKLQVEGSAKFKTVNSTTPTLDLISTNNSDPFLRFYDDSNGPGWCTGLDVSDEKYKISFDYDNTTVSSGTKLTIATNGNVGIGTTSPDEKLEVVGNASIDGRCDADSYKVKGLNDAPPTATSPGINGEIRYTADYIYVCVANNSWKRTALTTW